MNNHDKTKEELLLEIEILHQKIKDLENREETSLLLLQNPTSIIIKIGLDFSIDFVNDFAQHFFGYTEKEIIGANLESIIFPDTDLSKKEFREFIEDITEYPDTYRTFEIENVTHEGRQVWVEWTFRALQSTSGDVSEIVCIGNDVTHRKYIEEELKKAASTDLLTGLSTRKDFIDKFEMERYRFSRNGKQFCIVLCGVLNFAECLDTLGADCEDVVLKHVAEIMRISLRKSDSVGRWSGEEIIMMLPETNAEGAKTAVEKIVSSLSSSPVMNGPVEIMPSLCFCLTPFDHDREIDDIVSALYDCLDNVEAEGITETKVVILPPDQPRQ